MLLILTHDVDWNKKGPGIEHIIKRKNRFPIEVIEAVIKENYNPYYGIPEIMDIENRYGIKSTFFFRPYYDDGSTVLEYEDDLKQLIKNGWEIGLHINNSCCIEEIKKEKNMIEQIINKKIVGSRAHFLRINKKDIPMLKKADILYDSSLVYSKNRIDLRNAGFLNFDGVLEFPITFMDAYLFTYMGLKEEKVISFINKAIDYYKVKKTKVITLLWHDNSIKMKGGRKYSTLIDSLHSREDIRIVKAIDAYKMIIGTD